MTPPDIWWLSTLVAALPVIVLLGSAGLGHVKAHYAALLGLAAALRHCHLWLSHAGAHGRSDRRLGAGYGLFPIGWIVLNVIFMYQLTVESGRFEVLQQSLTGITQDRRLQLLLIAFCFGAFFEGAAGFGTPVAVTAALLIGLGFRPLQASGLSLIANTAPVAFGALGHAHHRAWPKSPASARSPWAPWRAAFCHVFCAHRSLLADLGLRRLLRACWRSGPPSWSPVSSFAITAVFHLQPPRSVAGGRGAPSIISMVCLVGFLMIWHPKRIWTFEGEEAKTDASRRHGYSRAEVDPRLGAVDHSQRHRLLLGHADRQEPDEYPGERL